MMIMQFTGMYPSPVLVNFSCSGMPYFDFGKFWPPQTVPDIC